MVSRSPSEFFIRFLLSKQAYDSGTILRMMEDFGLNAISERYIDKLKASMEPFPDPWKPEDRRSKPSQEFLKKHGIKDLWFPTPPIQEAYCILSNPQIRTEVEGLLLSPIRPEEIAKRLVKAHRTQVTPEGLAAYSHYFWRKSSLSTSEWVDYLEGKGDTYEKITALRASPDMATAMVPWLTGLSGPPSTLSTGAVAKRVRDVAFMKVLEIERQPATLAHSKMMLNYEKVIQAAEAEMRQSDVALKDVLSAFEKFRLRNDTKALPSIEEVAGPNFSKSGEGTGVVVTLDDDFYEEDSSDKDDDEE